MCQRGKVCNLVIKGLFVGDVSFCTTEGSLLVGEGSFCVGEGSLSKCATVKRK